METLLLNVLAPNVLGVIFPVPSNDTPPIVLAVAKAVAVAALPVQLPDEPLAFPVTLPVRGPANAVAVSVPVPALYVRPPSDFGARSPVADSNNATLHDVSVVSATVIVAGTMLPVPSNDVPPIVLADASAVAVAANPTAIFAVPSNDVPPIVLAVSSAVASAASPTAMFDVPSNEVPPIVLAVARAVAVAALPVVEPDDPLVLPVTLPVRFPANVDVKTPVDAL
tara:strand:- start:521 stop:1195 length:675 start_codon:yes stop_codon:yes gene_type:complete